MPISALSLIRCFPSTLRRYVPSKAQLDQNLLPNYMPSLESVLPKFWLFAMFIDLLVYSKCQIKWNSGQFWTSATNISWMKAKYILFLVWHSNESRNLAKSHQTMTSSVFNNNLTFWYFCVNFLIILYYKFLSTRITIILWSPGVGIWLIMVTQGWGNWHLKTWKCQISPGFPDPPILGQTIDRCIIYLLCFWKFSSRSLDKVIFSQSCFDWE